MLHKLEFIERLLEMQEGQLPSSPQLQVMHDEIQLAYELQKATLNELRNYMGLGLHIMRERTQEASGEWAVYSAPGKGTTIRARFPL